MKYLDMAWNLITDCDHTRVSHVIVHAPAYIMEEYQKAHANPKMIHYAGFMKPWHRPTEDYAQNFWSALKQTPYYEEVLFTMMNGVSYWSIYENVTKKRHFRNVIMRIANKLLPKGTIRREKVKKIVRIFHHA